MSANLDNSRVLERSSQCRVNPIERDLNDAEWTKLKPLLPAENRIGSPREVELRSCDECVDVCCRQWHQVVSDAARLTRVANGVWLLPALEPERSLGASQSGVRQASSPCCRARRTTKFGTDR